jgi:hypothetical protein
MGESYCLSSNEETFSGDYASREEAIAFAADELGVEPGGLFWVGRSVPYVVEVRKHTADRLVEQLAEDAYDEVGDVAEDWLRRVTDGQLTDLASRLDSVVEAWLEDYGHEPGFWRVEDVTEHRAPGVE